MLLFFPLRARSSLPFFPREKEVGRSLTALRPSYISIRRRLCKPSRFHETPSVSQVHARSQISYVNSRQVIIGAIYSGENRGLIDYYIAHIHVYRFQNCRKRKAARVCVYLARMHGMSVGNEEVSRLTSFLLSSTMRDSW